MKKRIVMLLLAFCLMANLLIPAMAEETDETLPETEMTADTSGTCGENLTWELDGTTLTISGSGEMDDGSPWDAHRKKIEKVVLTGGVTTVGAKAFAGYDRLESVDFGDALVEIGERAFYDCPDLTVIHLPATFRTFGAEAFRDCFGLKRVYCDGGMPRFNESCLWTGDYISVFYPTNNPWPAEPVNQLVSNFGGRLGVMMGNYSEDALAELDEPEETEAIEETEAEETEHEETEAPTEEPAEAPTEEPTEAPETEPVAVIVTEPVTEPTETAAPETEAPTEASTEAPETEPTEPAVEDLGGKSWIGLVMIAGVLTFLIAGALIFRSVSKKGGKYSR